MLLPNGNAQNATVRHAVWHVLPSDESSVDGTISFGKQSLQWRLESLGNRGDSLGWPHLNSIHDGLEVRLGAKLGSSIGNLWTKAPTWTTCQLSPHTEKFVYHPHIWRSNCALSIPFPIVLGIVFGWYWLNHTLRTRAILNESGKRYRNLSPFFMILCEPHFSEEVHLCHRRWCVEQSQAWTFENKISILLQFLYVFHIFFILCFKKFLLHLDQLALRVGPTQPTLYVQ